MGIIYVFIYGIFLLLLYVFILKRLKILSLRHSENTGIESLSRWYKIIRRRLVILLIILYILGSLILLIFWKNDLLYKTWLYNDKKALGNDVF